MRRTSLSESICPIARSLDEIGDWWTILIVRDAFHGKRRFGEFRESLGLARNILSSRLRTLVAHGILEKRAGDTRHCEYHLTEKGRQLRVVLTAIRQWGEANLFAEGDLMMVAHDRLRRPVARLRLTDQEGRPLEPEAIGVTQGRKRTASGRSATGRLRPSSGVRSR
jgi:DNA-binding HxlR family transcriptional regulator